jgi:ParB family chromosome partitioning protein
MKIDVTKIKPNPQQPRSEIDPTQLEALAESIRQVGVINAIAVEEASDGYILVDGERRWRAAMLAGLSEIEATVSPGLNGQGEMDRLTRATAANLVREDMNPVDRAKAFRKMTELGMNGKEIASACGCAPATVSDSLFMLEFSEDIKQYFQERKLPFSGLMIRAIRDIGDVDMQRKVVGIAVGHEMSGSAIIRMIKRMQFRKSQQRGILAAGKESRMRSREHWNMLMQAGVETLEERIEKAAVEVCMDCVLYDEASHTVCRECPGVMLLKKLEEAHAE